MRILCLSFGEHGESELLWRQPGMTLEAVKASRRAESEKAAAIVARAGPGPLHVADRGAVVPRAGRLAALVVALIVRHWRRRR